MDIVLFHEGNIESEHQLYIQSQTPLLRLVFVDISSHAFKKEKDSIPIEEVLDSAKGYRHMCSFWFVDFWHFVQDYDTIVRIDEDCYMYSSIDAIFLKLQDYTIVTGVVEPDDAHATVGLTKFTLDFIDRTRNRHSFTETTPKTPSGPYTNLIGFSLNVLRQNTLLHEYIQAIDMSEMIYRRRWGDLPLWGEAVHYILGTSTMCVDTEIKYIHGSHGKAINLQ